MNHHKNPFLDRTPAKDFKMLFQPDPQKNPQPFIDNCLSEIGLKVEKQGEDGSEADTLLKMKNELQINEQDFMFQNEFIGLSLEIKKPRSQMFSNKKEQQEPQSPKSQFSKQQQINRGQYLRSADRKISLNKDKSSLKKESIPIFNLLKRQSLKPNRKQNTVAKFTMEQLEMYKQVKWIVSQAMMTGQQNRQKLFEKYQVRRVKEDLEKWSDALERKKKFMQKFEKYGMLGKERERKKLRGIESSSDYCGDNQSHEFYQRLQRLQKITNNLLAEQNRYKDCFCCGENENIEQQRILNNNRNSNEKMVMMGNTLSIKNCSLMGYESVEKQRKQSLSRRSNQLNHLQQQQQQYHNNQSKSQEKKSLTLIDQYRQKLSSQGSLSLLSLSNKEKNHLLFSKSNERQQSPSPENILIEDDPLFYHQLQKALLTNSVNKNSITKSMTMGTFSLSDFMEKEYQRTIKQYVREYYQSKSKLTQLMETLKQQKRSSEFQTVRQEPLNSNNQSLPKNKRLLKNRQHLQIVNLTRLITPRIDLRHHQGQIEQKQLRLLNNFLPQQCRILLLLINNKSENENRKKQPMHKQVQASKLQTIQPVNPEYNIIKSISIVASQRIDNFSSMNFSNQYVNSQQLNNDNYNYQTPNYDQFHNNDKIKKANLLMKGRNNTKMTTSVMLKNDGTGIKTLRGEGLKSIRQGLSMRLPAEKSSHMQNNNYSPPKKTNHFTQLPSIDDQLRRQAILLYMPEEMDALQYVKQGIEQKIQRYIIQNGGGRDRQTDKQNQKKSFYVSKQQRERRRYEKEKKQRDDELQSRRRQQERKKYDKQRQRESYRRLNQNQQQQLNTAGLQLWEIRLSKQKRLSKIPQMNEQEVEILDSSREEEQRAKRFFKIEENGLTKQLSIIKPQKQQQKQDRGKNIDYSNENTKNNIGGVKDKNSPLLQYIQKFQQEEQDFKRKNNFQTDINKSKGNDLVINNRYWNTNNAGHRQFIDGMASRREKGQEARQIPEIKEVQSEEEIDSQAVSEQKILILSKKEQNKMEEKQKLPIFSMGGIAANKPPEPKIQGKQKQKEKKVQQQKPPAINIFQQAPQQKAVNIFAINKPKPQKPQQQQNQKEKQQQQTQKQSKSKQQNKGQNKKFPPPSPPQSSNKHLQPQQQQKVNNIPSSNETPSPKQQKQEQTTTNNPPLISPPPPKQQQNNKSNTSQQQFASFNPQQFQDAFKPTSNLKTFNTFESQQPVNQNIFQQFGQQIGQHLQNQTQQQQPFESFGPAAFMGNPQLPFLQNRSSGQEKNIFGHPNMFTAPGNQQPNSTNVNPFSIIHQNINQNQQQNNIFGSNHPPQQRNIFESQQQNQQQGNIFGSQSQQQGNTQQNQKQQGNIFGSQNAQGNVFTQKPNSQSQHAVNIFGGRNIDQQQQQNPNIPRNYMQPRK